jgi:hypothetical protein
MILTYCEALLTGDVFVSLLYNSLRNGYLTTKELKASFFAVGDPSKTKTRQLKSYELSLI